ncbi:RNA methyltransferase [Aciditerrimonas ferrireducens]|nr:RNA methyltransferase [Aciditerrimonas ferrireducens]MCK4177356.1 RNA methyltransferase [Aciditerrimonas ferrireducens]
MVEGPSVLAAALAAGAEVEGVYLAPGAPERVQVLAEQAAAGGARVFELAPGVLERVADTVTPQPVLAVVRQPRPSWASLGRASLAVVLAGARDPGNAGTVVRNAAAAGADLVVFGEESVDPFNPKTVRASAGAVLVVPVLCGPALEALAGLRAGGTRVLAAVARGGQPHTEVDLARPVALVLGNEAAGLDPAVAGACDEQVSVPMPGAVESLNLASAAAVLLFEAVRQRSNLPDVPRAGEGSKGPGGRW